MGYSHSQLVLLELPTNRKKILELLRRLLVAGSKG
jgi:hypothetical protein